MEPPLGQEAATADLVTDIIAPRLHRSSDQVRRLAPWELTDTEVSDLARDLTSGSVPWRNAWALAPPPDAPHETTVPSETESLTSGASCFSPIDRYPMIVAAQSGGLHAEVTDMAQTRTSAPAGDTPVQPAGQIPEKLTREEDDELRRLHWLSQVGTLAGKKTERLLELRLRDRRKEIRAPREFAEEKVDVRGGTLRRWFHFRSQ